MGVFEMVVLLVLIGTAGKVARTVVTRSSHGGDAATAARVQQLEAELRANEMRLAQAEERIAGLGDKLEFVENLLDSPERAVRLPPSGS